MAKREDRCALDGLVQYPVNVPPILLVDPAYAKLTPSPDDLDETITQPNTELLCCSQASTSDIKCQYHADPSCPTWPSLCSGSTGRSRASSSCVLPAARAPGAGNPEGFLARQNSKILDTSDWQSIGPRKSHEQSSALLVLPLFVGDCNDVKI